MPGGCGSELGSIRTKVVCSTVVRGQDSIRLKTSRLGIGHLAFHAHADLRFDQRVKVSDDPLQAAGISLDGTAYVEGGQVLLRGFICR